MSRIKELATNTIDYMVPLRKEIEKRTEELNKKYGKYHLKQLKQDSPDYINGVFEGKVYGCYDVPFGEELNDEQFISDILVWFPDEEKPEIRSIIKELADMWYMCELFDEVGVDINDLVLDYDKALDNAWTYISIRVQDAERSKLQAQKNC